MVTECDKDGCDRPVKSRGLCAKHYDRWRVSAAAVEVRGECSREGCHNPRRTRGMCSTHYTRWRKKRQLDRLRQLAAEQGW